MARDKGISKARVILNEALISQIVSLSVHMHMNARAHTRTHTVCLAFGKNNVQLSSMLTSTGNSMRSWHLSQISMAASQTSFSFKPYGKWSEASLSYLLLWAGGNLRCGKVALSNQMTNSFGRQATRIRTIWSTELLLEIWDKGSAGAK